MATSSEPMQLQQKKPGNPRLFSYPHHLSFSLRRHEILLHPAVNLPLFEQSGNHAEHRCCAGGEEDRAGGDVVGVVDRRDAVLLGEAVKRGGVDAGRVCTQTSV
jgi:hypothetical protein